jgi:hypothetical protein
MSGQTGNVTGTGYYPITPQALWDWGPNPSNPNGPLVIQGYNTFSSGPTPTKTGLTAQDIQDYCGVPLYYKGNPPRAVTEQEIIRRIRRMEDSIEQNSSVLLTPTYIASEPIRDVDLMPQLQIISSSGNGIMNQGVEYDLADDKMDFRFEQAQDNGWLNLMLRYKPLNIFNSDQTAVKKWAYVYPLLSAYFNISPSWFVENRPFGYLRVVPAQNVQLLPLFMLQLSVQGYTSSTPGGIALYYTAGLSENDYNTRFSFIRELVCAATCASLLGSIQGTYNLGTTESALLADGLQYSVKYDPKGPFAGLIANFNSIKDELLTELTWQTGGFTLTSI